MPTTSYQLKIEQHKAFWTIRDDRKRKGAICVYLKPGFHTNEYPGTSVRFHLITGETMCATWRAMQQVKPCDCPDCLKG